MVIEQKNNSCDYGSFEETLTVSGNLLTDSTTPIKRSNSGGGVDTSVPSEIDPLVHSGYQNQSRIHDDWSIVEQRIHHQNGSSDSGPSSPRSSITVDIPTPSREKQRFPKEKWKTFIAFLFLTFNMVLTTTTLSLVHEKVPDREKYGPLPDVVLDNIKEDLVWPLYASEVLIITSLTSAIFVMIFHKHRFIVMRRVFLIIGLLYLMRCITMYVTVLPMANSTYYCSPKSNSTQFLIIMGRSLHLLSGLGLSINGKHTYCGDYVYSGHTVILVISYLIIQEYTPRRCLLFHWLAGLAAIAGMVFILIAKAHYTLDVVIAYYVTTRLFWIYHQMACHKEFKKQSTNNFLSRVWWFFIFNYFEKNVNGILPKEFNWPLSLPRRFYAKQKHPHREI